MGLKSKTNGKGFEEAFKVMAQLKGYRVLKIPEFGQWLGPGAFKPIEGWVDFMLIDSEGRTAFVDTKTIDDVKFKYSLISPHQLKFLESVGDLCPAGYVVHYKPLNKVVYHRWIELKMVGPKESVQGGIELGLIPDIDISKIFKASRT